MSASVRGLILCGGQGSRLQPITDWIPKQTVPVLDKPLLAFTVERFRSAGITEIFINGLYNLDHIRECLGDGSRYGVSIHYYQEPFQLGTAGILRYLENYWTDGPLVVSVGDMISTLDLGAFLEFHKNHPAAATVACIHHNWPPEDFYGDIAVVDESNRVTEYQWKPGARAKSRIGCSGAWILNHEVLSRVPTPVESGARTEGVDLNRDVLPEVAADPNLGLYAFISDHKFDDFGLPECFVEGTARALSGQLDVSPVTKPNEEDQHIHPDASIAQTALLRGPVLVDRDAVIESGCEVVGPTVIGAGSRIRAGSTIRTSVILPGAEVQANCVVLRALIADRVSTPKTIRKYYWSRNA